MAIKWIGKLSDDRILMENNPIPGLELKPFIDATDMPTKEEIRYFLDVIPNSDELSPEIQSVMKWLEKLAAE